MKKFSKISSLLMLLISFVSVTANAQNSFFLNPIDLEPGTTGTLELMLTNPDTQFYGFSVDVTLPKGLEFVKKSDGKADVSLNPDRFGSSYQVVSNISNGKLLMGTFSSDVPQQPIEGTSGTIVYIKVKVAPDFKESTLTLSNIKLINEDDRDVPMLQQTPKIGVLPTSITFDKKGLSLQVEDGEKEAANLLVTFTPEWTTNRNLTWSSSDESIATVDAEGKVTAEYKGTAIITATTVNGKTATCFVSVGIPVTSVEMDPPSATIMDSESLTITATPLPMDADNREFVQWYSSDETVATVDDSGTVTPIRAGEVTITAQCGSATGTSTVTVIPTPAESVTILPESAEVMVDKTVSLTAEVLPDVTTDKTVIWSSSDPTKATVDDNGVVTGVALGQTTITATCGTVSGICIVTVIPTPAESVTLSPESAEMRVGESVTLTATVSPDDTTDKTVTWTSSDETIATVDEDGVVTGVAVGEVTITVSTHNDKTATCTVKVNPVLSESITLSAESAELKVGETTTLTPTILPENTTDKTVTWSSSDETIATVDEDGVVTALALGETTITATCGTVSATCTITVVPTPVESISLDRETAELKVDETVTLIPTILPEDATDKTVTWTSSDETIATVDADGKVTALVLGETTITATCGGATASCVVAVVPTPVLSISLDRQTAELKVAETVTLIPTVLPEDATDKTVTWSTSDETIATVDADGKVTAVALGQTIVTATCGTVTASCVVTVVPTPAESITLNPTSVELKVGESAEISAEVLPEDTTDKTVTWTTGDEAIATVDANGKVTGTGLGETTVTATCGTVTASCKVTVVPTPVTGISLTNTTLLMKVGNISELAAIIQPADATDQSVTWSSEDQSIATVDDNGTVTAIAPGIVKVIVTSVSNPAVTAECLVTVEPDIIMASNIALNESSIEIFEEETFDLIATVSPEDATDKTVTWESSDITVATVSETGQVTAVKAGVAVIYASTSSGLTAECAVTVRARVIEPTGISLTNTEMQMTVGDIADLIAVVSPDNATDPTVTWTSEDESIATVDANGIVTAVNVGVTKITATASNGISAVCAVTVVPATITVESIELNRTELELTEGDTYTLIATVLPENATDKTVTWRSSDRAVATVSENGEVIAVSAGAAVIYASSSNGLTAECAVTVIPDKIEVTGITLSNTELTLREGHTADLIPIVKPENADDKTVTWTSEDESIATVDVNGIVTAIKVGVTKITATASNGMTATCTVTVVPDFTAVESLELNRTELELIECDTYTLIATVLPENATDKTVTWKSSDKAIATVSENGEVTAVKAGTTVIYASSSNGITVECVVTVIPGKVEVTGITLSNTELTIREGHTADLIPIVKPENADDKTVTWTTEDETIATVDANGIVTAVKVGVTKITATTSNGMTATCTVTVVPDFTAVESLELNRTELELIEGDTYTLIATVMPENATDKTVTWKSSDKAIATVSENGEVTAVKAGTTIIYASSSNGITAECVVTVVPGEIAVQSITLSNTELLMKVGEISELVAIIHPSDATDQSVVWHSNDESIATVDQQGNVTAKATGTMTVTVTSVAYPLVSAECKVIVEANVIAVTGIELNKTELNMTVGDNETLVATITPEDATDKTVTWKSSDPAVATVSDNGEVTAVSVGTAIIYASSSNGLTAQCDVTVNPGVIPVESISLSNTEMTLREGHTADLIAIIRPSDATDKSVTWTTEDETIATVDATGIVTAVKVGVTKITATASNGMTAICTVTVVPDFVAVENIELNKTELEMIVGDKETLIATITPENATDKTVTWKSSDPAIATVSEDGEVTAVSVGKVIIYASSSNGMTVQCDVTVNPGVIPVESISLSNTEMTLREGHTADLIAIIRPSDATDKSVTWASEDETIATVDANGIVTAVKVGVTKIIATASNGMTAICTLTVVPDFIAVENIELNRTELELTEGDTFTLIATITPENATDKTVTWKSSDPSVATVSENGEVTAISAGIATIYASSSNGLTAECAVTVVRGVVEVTGISLSNTELLMTEGEITDLIAIVRPFDATDPRKEWTSTDESIVTVDENGVVTAVKPGIAIVTVTSVSNPAVKAECIVTVVPKFIAVTGINLNKEILDMIEGDKEVLIATITPEDATDKTVTWLSSNSNIATVSENGEVIAVGVGSAIIYASSFNGLTAICEVNVSPRIIEVTSITLDATDLVLWEGETATLVATIDPEDATDKSVTWTSNYPEIAIVEDGVVKGLKAGTATVIAKSSNGKNAYCSVTVKERPFTPRQLLRKGDGTTCTFVILMDLSDAELVELGYQFVVGYTDSYGQSAIIAQTPLRYCHTTSEIFNNPSYDFWTFAFIENEAGEIACSNLRHLDGSEEVCFDPSIYGFDPSRSRSMVNDGDDWLTVTPMGLSISINSPAETTLAVYTISGVMVYSKTYSGEAQLTDIIELTQFVPGSYLVTLNCAGDVKAKKILVR